MSALRRKVFGFLFFLLPAVSAHAFVLSAQLVGDSRVNNPDNIVLDVTITVAGNMASWIIDINSPAHPSAKLDEFYFNLASMSANNLTFSGFDPVGWTINAPASVQGAGGTTFQFEAAKTAPSALNVNQHSKSSIHDDEFGGRVYHGKLH